MSRLESVGAMSEAGGTEVIEQELIAILCSVLDAEPDEFDSGTRIAGHANWDSMGSLEVMVQIENAFAVRLDLRAYHAVRTVAELVTLVRTASKSG